MHIPERNRPLPLLQNRLILVIKPRQNLLLRQFRQQLPNIVVKTNQALLNNLQRSNSSQKLSLRSKQEDSVVLDIRRAFFDGNLAGGVAVLEIAYGWRKSMLAMWPTNRICFQSLILTRTISTRSVNNRVRHFALLRSGGELAL